MTVCKTRRRRRVKNQITEAKKTPKLNDSRWISSSIWSAGLLLLVEADKKWKSLGTSGKKRCVCRSNQKCTRAHANWLSQNASPPSLSMHKNRKFFTPHFTHNKRVGVFLLPSLHSLSLSFSLFVPDSSICCLWLRFVVAENSFKMHRAALKIIVTASVTARREWSIFH